MDGSLYAEWKRADGEARLLRSRIDACRHDWRWTQAPTTTLKRVFSPMDGFYVEQGLIYAMRHERRCVACGLEQKAIQLGPNDAIEWKDA